MHGEARSWRGEAPPVMEGSNERKCHVSGVPRLPVGKEPEPAEEGSTDVVEVAEGGPGLELSAGNDFPVCRLSNEKTQRLNACGRSRGVRSLEYELFLLTDHKMLR